MKKLKEFLNEATLQKNVWDDNSSLRQTSDASHPSPWLVHGKEPSKEGHWNKAGMFHNCAEFEEHLRSHIGNTKFQSLKKTVEDRDSIGDAAHYHTQSGKHVATYDGEDKHGYYQRHGLTDKVDEGFEDLADLDDSDLDTGAVRYSHVGKLAHGVAGMTIPAKNKESGFHGTVNGDKHKQWSAAFNAVHKHTKMVGGEHRDTRNFLDSHHGQALAHAVNNGLSPREAMKKHFGDETGVHRAIVNVIANRHLHEE